MRKAARTVFVSGRVDGGGVASPSSLQNQARRTRQPMYLCT